MKKRLLSLLVAAALAAAMSGCQVTNKVREVQSGDIDISIDESLQTSVTNVPTDNIKVYETAALTNEKAETLKSDSERLFIADIETTDNDIEQISLQSNIKELTVFFYNKDSQTNLSLEPLSDLSELKVLRLGGYCNDLSIISEMSSLEKIEIVENYGIVNLDNLGYNEDVRELTISSALIKNIDNITQLPNLETLTIENIECSDNIDLSCLGELYRLNKLYLKWLDFDSIEFIGKLNDLEELFIWSNNFNVQGYQNIQKCTNLNKLCLYNIDLENLKFLCPLSLLTDLELRWGNVGDISALPQIHSLNKLEMWGIAYSDSLCEMNNLDELIIYETELTSEQIENLNSSLPNCTVKF